MGDEYKKKKEPGVADIVPVRIYENREKLDLPPRRQKEPSLPEPSTKTGTEIAQAKKKEKSSIS